MVITPIHAMVGRVVRVIASDIVYRGVLIEVSEETVELQGEAQWITIPVGSINSITVEEG